MKSTAGEEKDSDTFSNAESTAGGSTKNGTKTKLMTDFKDFYYRCKRKHD